MTKITPRECKVDSQRGFNFLNNFATIRLSEPLGGIDRGSTGPVEFRK